MSYQKHNFTPGAVLLASQLNDMDNEIETLSQGGSGGTVLSDDFKEALLNCFENVVWTNENGQTYYDALYDSLYPDNMWFITNTLTGCTTSNSATSILKNNSYVATIIANEGYSLDGATVNITMGGNDVTNLYYSSGSINIPNVTGNLVITVSAVSNVSYITATFDQGEDIIYDTDSLDVLNQYLTVRAFYDNSESIILDYTEYELSGTLTEGTSTITVSYGGKTTTFNVTVTHIINGWLYEFNGSLLSSGTEDFGLQGNEVYDTGLFNKQCYKHFIPTPGTASSDTQMGLKAVNLQKSPNFNSDFTLSFWCATQNNHAFHPFTYTKYVNGNTPAGFFFSNYVVHDQEWSHSTVHAKNTYAGMSFYASASSADIKLSIHSSDLTHSDQLSIVFPSSVDTTTWHHYALTRKGNDFKFFFDGSLKLSMTGYGNVYAANQVAISSNFTQSSASASVIQQMPYGEKIQDLYIAEFCKWESDFNPQTITY